MRDYSYILIALIILIATSALAGWLSGVDLLMNPVSGDNIAMNPMSALCMLLLSSAFAIQLKFVNSRRAMFATAAIAATVMAIAIIKLLASWGINLNIDYLLFTDRMSSLAERGVRSRMAPNSGFSFLLISSVILIRSFETKKLTAWPNAVALTVFFIGGFSFIGFIYRVEEYRGVFNYIPMAFETGACFILFALLLLYAHRHESFMGVISSTHTGGVIARQVIPFVMLMPVTLGFIWLYIWRHHPVTVQLGAAALISSIIFVSLCLLWYFARALNQADEHQQEGEAQLRRQAVLLQMMPGGIMYMNSERRITEINEAAAAMFGLDKNAVVGEKVDDHLQLSFLTDPDPALRMAKLKQNGSWVGEIQATNKKTGKKITVVSHNKLVNDMGAQQHGNMMVFTDITERRTAEERMELAIDGTAGGLWDLDMVNNIPWWSPRYPELLGYPADTPPSIETFERLVHPEDGARFHAEIAYNSQHHIKRFETELRYLSKAGVYKWFQVFARIKYSDEGFPIRIAGSIIDIDDKKQAQELLKLQADLFGVMPDATLYGKKDLTIRDMNHAAEYLFGVTKDEAIGRRIDELVTFEVLDISREDARKDLWGEKGFWRGECIITTSAGRQTKVIASAKAIKDDKGEAIGWLGIYTDISLLQINEELTEALHKEEDNVRYLEQLAYISTHDLKAPIIAAQSLIDILVKRDGVKEEHHKVLELIRGTVEQMRRTNFALNDILKVRKDLVNKKSTASMELATLSTIMTDVSTTLQKNIEEKEGVLHVEMGDTAELKLPYLHFKSILYNLTSNSIKYSDPKRPLVITIKAEKSTDGGLRLSIEDNGLGIDLNMHQNKLFGVFKRFHSHVEGTGVGLHIVKSIIDIYDGEVIVKSHVGVGTTFDISFPATNIASWN